MSSISKYFSRLQGQAKECLIKTLSIAVLLSPVSCLYWPFKFLLILESKSSTEWGKIVISVGSLPVGRCCSSLEARGECWTSTEYLQIYHDYSRRCERHSKLPIWTQSGRKCSQWRWHFVYIAGWDCNLTFRRRPTNFTPRLTSLKKQPKMPTPLVTSMMLTSETLERKLESLKQILKKSLRRWCSQVPKWMRQKKSLRTKMMMWMLSPVASFFLKKNVVLGNVLWYFG